MSKPELISILNGSERSLNELGEFVSVYMRGIHLGRELPKVVGQMNDVIRELERLRKKGSLNFKPLSIDELNPAIRAFQKLVTEHTATKFEYLHGVGLVQIWTALEATMNDFCLEAMTHNDAWKNASSAQNIRLKVAEILTLDKAILMRQLLDSMLTELGARRGNGVDRFEMILAELGFGGAVDARVSRQLLWLAEARNVLIHRQGIVDRKFVRVVSWTHLQPGDRLSLTGRDFKKSRIAVRAYITTIKMRLVALKLAGENKSHPPFLAECIESLRQYEDGTALK